jgi:hypothetical protein
MAVYTKFGTKFITAKKFVDDEKNNIYERDPARQIGLPSKIYYLLNDVLHAINMCKAELNKVLITAMLAVDPENVQIRNDIYAPMCALDDAHLMELAQIFREETKNLSVYVFTNDHKLIGNKLSIYDLVNLIPKTYALIKTMNSINNAFINRLKCPVRAISFEVDCSKFDKPFCGVIDNLNTCFNALVTGTADMYADLIYSESVQNSDGSITFADALRSLKASKLLEINF